MINFLCLLCSLCIQFCAIDLPYNFSTVNTNNYTTVTTLWEDLVGRGYNVDPDYMIVVYRANQSRQYYVYYPNEPFNQQQSTISLSGRNESTGTLNVVMTNWRRFTFTNIDTYYNLSENSSLGSCSFQLDDGTNWGNSTNIIIWNARYNLPYDNLDTFNWSSSGSGVGTLPGLGSLSGSGHSSGGDPLEDLQGFSWSAHTSTYTQSGHNTHVNPNNATPDFTNATQNLLGQIVDNTNSLISNTNNIGGALETINGNIINGASALFNAISQLNNNFVSSVIIDKEELNDQWTASNTYLAFVSMNNSFNLLQSTAEDLIDRYSATEDVDELIIPIDLTVWQIESSNFGDFKPFNQVYYMRFGFLDETKALWQPLFIALLYFCLFYGIVLDLPNIIRGVKS